MSKPFIELIDIHKCFDTNAVLKGVNLTIDQGKITTVIGKSGTGKSVLLKHIIGLLHQDSGQLLINGIPLDRMNKKTKHGFQKELSYMFQDNALFDFLTVYENIALPLTEKTKQSSMDIKKHVLEKMRVLGLTGTQNKYPSQLSGGMRKRVALARALITDPKAVLFDEPTTGLDPVRKNNVHSMIAQYQKEFGFTAIIVTHDIPEIFEITQDIAMLDRGKIIFQGTTLEILNSDNPSVNSFIQGQNYSTKAS
ncbi:MAG: ATP-binding cassette domain-containing protein [Desulfobacter sp.]|nr:ATP-binding cassette domain-containing protein [Desulfobacter sp.]WDP86020.1 MAG: ATP-binding cassette domain-containing protein [Desulfobacter sp.]